MEADITSQAVGLASNTDFSILQLFVRADIVVKSVIIILIASSIYSWAVIIEQVSAMPGQGVTSMFNFGQSYGVLKGIFSAMQIPMDFVSPVKWKKYYNLINTQKDSSRTKAIEFFPYISAKLSRKKDANKADAILIASFYYQNQKKLRQIDDTF